ncbi:MAG: hypothetical protein WBC91_06290 [Phototrophicaceae bacterium]
MAEAVGTTIDSGGSVSQPPGNVSLDAAIAYINDFAANAQMVEGMFSMMLVIAASMGSQVTKNEARLLRLERGFMDLSSRIASIKIPDEIDRPIGSGGGNRSSTAPTSAQFSGE